MAQPEPPESSWARHLPASVDRGAVAALGSTDLTSGWARTWGRTPAHRLIHDPTRGWVTAGELEDRTRRVAGALSRLGVEAGDRVLLSGDPGLDVVVAHVAALRLGLVVVPVNPAYRAREVAEVVAVARPTVAIVADGERAGWVRAASDGSVAVTGFDELERTTGADRDLALDQARPEDPALMVFTSGTTGAPKGVALSHASLSAGAEAVALAWRWGPEDRLVLALPLFHLHGLGVGLHGTLSAGASVVLRPSFDACDVLDATERHRASLFFGVPTMYRRLAESGRVGDLARLRLCVSGSAPLAVELHAAVASGSGQVILERYGMSETVMIVSNPYEGERRPGTVGFALPGVEVRLAEGTSEILVRGPNVFSGYWERPDASAEAFEDGWFHTGDLGRFDDDGYLRIVGRSKELIISGGFNVHPREVEDVLRRHPGVTDVAVVGVADAQWGEVVVAHVEGDADLGALQVLAAAELAPYKRPKRIHLGVTLPRNALGKVVKADLREP